MGAADRETAPGSPPRHTQRSLLTLLSRAASAGGFSLSPREGDERSCKLGLKPEGLHKDKGHSQLLVATEG